MIYSNESVQKKTFSRWINAQLDGVSSSVITDLYRDLRDGRKLKLLIEILTNEHIFRPVIGQTSAECLKTLERVIYFLKTRRVHMKGLTLTDISEGKPKRTLDLIWLIIFRFKVLPIVIETDNGLISSRDALLYWCQKNTEGYKNVDVTDFSKSWRSGLAFAAIIHRHRPNLIDFDTLSITDAKKNLKEVLDIAEQELNLKRLLDAEDIDVDNPDEKAMITYITTYYDYFSTLESLYIDDDFIVRNDVRQNIYSGNKVKNTKESSRKNYHENEIELKQEEIKQAEFLSYATAMTNEDCVVEITVLPTENIEMNSELAELLDHAEENIVTITETTVEYHMDEKECIKMLDEFSTKLTPENWMAFGRLLGIPDNVLDAVDVEGNICRWGLKEKCYQMLSKWRQTFPQNVRKGYLNEKLRELLTADEQREGMREITEMLYDFTLRLDNKNWKIFGRYIGMSDLELDTLEIQSNIRQWGVREKCYQMLRKWKMMFPENVNLEFLNRCLKNIEDNPNPNPDSMEMNSLFLDFAKQLTTDTWRSFGRHLGLSDQQLEALDEKDREKNWGLQEKCYQMLKEWYKQTKNKNISENYLVTILREVKGKLKTNEEETRSVTQFLHDFTNQMDPQNWKAFGRHIGMKEDQLDSVETEGNVCQWNDQQKCYQMLWEWSKSREKFDEAYLNDALHCFTVRIEFTQETGKVIKKLIQFTLQFPCDEWRTMGYHLGLTKEELDSLELEAEVCNWDEQKLCYQMLRKWQEKYSLIVCEPSLIKDLERKQLEIKEDQIARLRSELMKLYMNNYNPDFPWMESVHLKYEDYRFNITTEEEAQAGNNGINGSSKKSISLEEIFIEETTRRPKRILVQGKKHSGKTSLCMKLAYDWANSREYMKKFQFVFVIYLKDLKCKLKEFLKKRVINFKMFKIYNTIIKAGEGNTLLLLDGYDEIRKEVRSSVLKLLNGKLLPDINCLLTTKANLPLEENETNCSRITCRNFQRIFTLSKLDVNYKETILLKYIYENDENCKGKVNELLQCIPQELSDCPLFLILIGNLCKYLNFIPNFNKLELYMKLSNFIINKWLGENNKSLKFYANGDSNANARKKMQLLTNFGKRTLKCLNEKKMYLNGFTPKEADDIIKMGFIYKINTDCDNDKILYQPLNNTFMEYLAAYYLLRIRKTENLQKTILSLKNCDLWNFERSMMLPFLVKLLEKEVPLLMKALTPLVFFYSFNLHSLLSVINNKSITEEMLSALVQFVPVRLELLPDQATTKQSFPFVTELLNYEPIRNKIEIVSWDPQLSIGLTRSVKINKLELRLKSVVIENLIEAFKFVECEELTFSLQYQSKESLENDWLTITEEVKKLKTGRISFAISSLQEESCSVISKELISGSLRLSKIFNIFLLCYRNQKNALLSLIEVIKYKPIQNLCVIVKEKETNGECLNPASSQNINQSEIDSLLTSISNNKEITEFVFHNFSSSSYEIDLHRLTNKTKKSFHLLWFIGITCKVSGSERNDYAIDALMIHSSSNETDKMIRTISRLPLSVLGGCLSTIHAVVKRNKKRNLLRLRELDVYLTNDINQKTHLHSLREFSNLQTLCLAMRPLKENFNARSVKDIVNIIISLKQLESFEIRFIENNVDFAFSVSEELMKCLCPENEPVPKNSSCFDPILCLNTFVIGIDANFIKEMKINESGLQSVLFSIMDLTVRPLRQRRLKEFCLLLYNPDDLQKDFPLRLLDEYPIRNGFTISWDLEGRINGSARNKSLLKHSHYIYRFSVSYP